MAARISTTPKKEDSSGLAVTKATIYKAQKRGRVVEMGSGAVRMPRVWVSDYTRDQISNYAS